MPFHPLVWNWLDLWMSDYDHTYVTLHYKMHIDAASGHRHVLGCSVVDIFLLSVTNNYIAEVCLCYV